MHPWWNDQQAGLIGGIVGSALGLYGAAFGIVASYGAQRGRWRRAVIAMNALLILIGIVSLSLAVIALLLHQPYGVWYVLLLPGVLALVLGTTFAPIIKARYREADNRRLEAEQLRRS